MRPWTTVARRPVAALRSNIVEKAPTPADVAAAAARPPSPYHATAAAVGRCRLTPVDPRLTPD